MQHHPRSLWIVFGILLVDTMGFGIVIPVLPKLVEHMLGGAVGRASTVYGLLLASFSLMGFLFSPVMGALADRFGRRPILTLSLFALTVDYVILANAPTVGWLFLGRIIAGIFSATVSVTSAYVADTSPPDRRVANFGFIGVGTGLGLISGPLLGGSLGLLGARAPFWAAAGLAAANCAAAFFLLPESLKPEYRRPFRWRDASPIGTFMIVAQTRVIVVLLAVAFLVNLAAQILLSTWVLYTGYRYGWGAFEAGASVAAFGLLFAVSQVALVRILVHRIGEWRTLLLGLVLGSACYLVFAFAAYPWEMSLNILPYAIASGISGPALQALATHNMPVDQQGLLQGAMASLVTATGVIGPPIGAFLFSYFISPDRPFTFPGAAFVLAAALTFAALAVIEGYRNSIPHETHTGDETVR